MIYQAFVDDIQSSLTIYSNISWAAMGLLGLWMVGEEEEVVVV